MKPSSSSTSLKRLGAKLAELQDARALDDDSLERAREAFLAAGSRTRTGAAGGLHLGLHRWALVAAALVVLCSAAYAIVVRPRAAEQPLAFQVGEAGKVSVLAAGEWLAAPKTASLPVHFSDGTELRFAPSSRGRIVDVGNLGARVVLERGETHAQVVHRESTKWYFAAGPFEVHVTGTQFQVGWQPGEGVFTLDLEEGSVTVTGCGLGSERAVHGGQSLRLVCDEERMVATETLRELNKAVPAPSLEPAPEPTGGERTPEAVPSAPSGNVAPKAPPRTTHVPESAMAKAPEPASSEDAPEDAGAPEASSPPPPGWRLLFGADRFHEAYAAAAREGWSRLCDERDVSDLSALADMARFTGHFDEAEQALRAIRRRFPTDERAAWAAFQLGRLSFDQRAQPREAATWFDAAYRERPSGPIAREALGRLMEARERSGTLDAAREAARTYMTRYPSGPHAERARSLLRP